MLRGEFLMITNLKMNKNLWDRLARGEEISEERLMDCFRRICNEGRNVKHTGTEKYKRLILLKKPDKMLEKLYEIAPD